MRRCLESLSQSQKTLSNGVIILTPTVAKKNRKMKKKSSLMTAGTFGRRGYAVAADEMTVTTRLMSKSSSAKPPEEQTASASTDNKQLHGGTIHVHNPEALRLLCDLRLDDHSIDESPDTDNTRIHEDSGDNVTVANAELLLRLLSSEDDPPLTAVATASSTSALASHPCSRPPRCPTWSSGEAETCRGVGDARGRVSRTGILPTKSGGHGPKQRRPSSGGKFGRRLRQARHAAFNANGASTMPRRGHTR